MCLELNQMANFMCCCPSKLMMIGQWFQGSKYSWIDYHSINSSVWSRRIRAATGDKYMSFKEEFEGFIVELLEEWFFLAYLLLGLD